MRAFRIARVLRLARSLEGLQLGNFIDTATGGVFLGNPGPRPPGHSPAELPRGAAVAIRSRDNFASLT